MFPVVRRKIAYAILTVQARFDSLRPTPCKVLLTNSDQCDTASGTQLALLYSGLYLVALGTGGIKAALPSLGADQFNETDPKEAAQLASFFNWLIFSLTAGSAMGVTFLVWISDNKGWDWSFGVCAIALFFSLGFLFMGKSLYRNNVPQGRSPIVRIIQVFVVAGRNWKLPIPEKTEELHQLKNDQETGMEIEILQRTNQFGFLDRAAIITSPSSNELDPWRTCSMTQIEETKILIRMLPIILSTVFMNTCLAQLQTFSIQQGITMDRRLGNFHVPAASLPVIPLIFMSILIPIYDRFFVPFIRKYTGIPTGIRHLQRIGVGLVLSIFSMAIAGLVETHRKSVARQHGMVDSMQPLPVSMFWLGFQYGVFGAADMFTLVGLMEFFYEESSVGMKSLGTAISWSSLAFGYFGSTAVVETVNHVSGGWLARNNLNRDKLNYFYYLLAGVSVVNFGVYLVCSSWYKYKKVEGKHLESKSGGVELK